MLGSPSVRYLAEHTENHADGPTTWWTPASYLKPHHSKDAYASALAVRKHLGRPTGCDGSTGR